jgi:hypothetical protein
MMLTRSLYGTCREFFMTYPLASDEVNGAIRSMVLMLHDCDEVSYFVLSQNCRENRSWYSICLWPAGPVVTIEADRDALVPEMFASALSCGTPLPRDGSLFGWRRDGIVNALIAVYTEYSPAVPEPCWSVMPRAGVPDTQWPPFTGEPLIGNRFWELQQAGTIISVEGLIARSTNTVFWANTEAAFGSGCCLVARDLRSPDGYMLPSGRYVYHKVLRAGSPVPSLQELLADTGKTDLATRFR